MSEARDKIVQPGNLVGFDTGANATEGQKEAYRISYDCVNAIRETMKVGMTFAEFVEEAPELPTTTK